MKLKTKQNYLLTLIVLALFFNFSAKAQVNIGNQNNPKNYSLLELNSASRGLRLPHLTTIQRSLISDKWKIEPLADKLEGLVIYNIDNNCLEFWNGSVWISQCTNSVMERSEKPIIRWQQSDLIYRSTGCYNGEQFSGFCTGTLASPILYGAGVAGAKITITWCNGASVSTTVGIDASCNNFWSFNSGLIPSDCNQNGKEVQIVQTEPGKLPSEPVILYLGDQNYCHIYN